MGFDQGHMFSIIQGAEKSSSIGRVSTRAILCTCVVMHVFHENPDVASISDELLYGISGRRICHISYHFLVHTCVKVFGGFCARRFIPNIADSAEK